MINNIFIFNYINNINTMSIIIEDNKHTTISDLFYIQNAIHFTINDISVPLANSIRRTILSDIPSIAFDDTWVDNEHDRSIRIVNNTSGLHNEFLSHRLSLIPINRYEYSLNDSLGIQTVFNKKTNKRELSFSNEEEIPIFKLHKQHLSDTDMEKNNYGLIEVNSSHIQYEDDVSDIDYANYFKPDLYIKETLKNDEYIIINMLKPNEELELYMTPTIGLGRDNARYCTVGTVSYSFNIDEEKVDTVFEQIIRQENKERIEKKLKPFGDEDIEKKKKSFMLLDKERVFQTNTHKEPNSFHYCVESIGTLPSHQIVYDSLTMIRLRLHDIIHSFTGFIKDATMVKDTTIIIYNNKEPLMNNKVNVYQSVENLLGYIITIKNCNHTLGNLINYYTNSLFTNIDRIETERVTIPNFESLDLQSEDMHTYNQAILEQCGYKMPHPLQEEIEFKLKLSSNIGEFEMFQLYEEYSLEINKLYPIQTGTTGLISDQEKQKVVVIYTFIKSIQAIQQIITNMLRQWTSETAKFGDEINKPSFIIKDTFNEPSSAEQPEQQSEKENEATDED